MPEYPDISSITLASVREEGFGLAASELPEVTNYNSGGLARRLIEMMSRGHYEVYNFVRTKILPQCYLATAESGWLDHKAREIGVTRLPAAAAEHEVTFTRTNTAGNLVVPAAGIVATGLDSTGTRYRFQVIADVVAAAGQASIRVPVRALETGAASNLGAGQITEFVTAFPGWDSVTNDSDSLTSEGRDVEADGRILQSGEPITAADGLRRRIGLKRAAGNTCNWAAYLSWALEAGATDALVTKTRATAGSVDIYIMGPTGAPSDSLLEAVEARLSDLTAETGPVATDDWMVWSVITVDVDYEFELIMYPGQAGDSAAIQAKAAEILDSLHNPSKPVDGAPLLGIGTDVVRSQVFEALRAGGLGGLKSINWTTPAADTAVAEHELAVIGATPVITVSEATED